VYRSYRGEGFDLAQASARDFIQDSLDDELMFFIVFNQIEHLIWSYEGESLRSQINVNHLVVLDKAQVGLGNV
jgi:hypothetical protein